MNTPVKVQRVIALVSVLLFLGKLWAWYLTHSVSILTDALESTVNVITGLIGLYSVVLAAKPRDANHPYGHGKVEFISAAIEGALIAIAGLMIIYEVIANFLHPKALNQIDAGIIITCSTGVVNYLLGVYALRLGRRNRSMTIEASAHHLKSDAYSTFAIVGGLLVVWLSGWQWVDAVVALVFALVIIVTGYKVLRKSLGGIMDEADVKLLDEVIKVLIGQRRDQWIDLHNMRVIQYGQVLHIDAHMTLPWYWTVAQADSEIHQLEDLIKEQFQGKVEFFIHIDQCMPYSCRLCALEHCPERKAPYTGRVEWNRDNILANEKHGK